MKYYYAASRRIAMRTITSSTDTLYWLISDHLSSTTIITDESGTIVSEMKYTAFGEIRDINGTSPTDYLYTGQRKEVEFGLSYYVARWYDATLAHFTSADTLIPQPGDSQAWDRFAYVLNNPLKYTDPSGHYYSGSEANDFYQQTQYDGSYYDITSLYDRPDTTWQLAAIYIYSSNFYHPEYANGISLPDGPGNNPMMPTIGLGGVGSIEAQTPLVAAGVDALGTIANDVLNIVSLFHDDQSHNVFAYQIVELFGEDELLEIVGILIVNYSKMEIEVIMNEPNGICGYVPRGEYDVFPMNGAGYSWDPPYKHGNSVDHVYTVDFTLAGYAGDFPKPGKTSHIVGPKRFYREYFYNDYKLLINAYHNQ